MSSTTPGLTALWSSLPLSGAQLPGTSLFDMSLADTWPNALLSNDVLLLALGGALAVATARLLWRRPSRWPLRLLLQSAAAALLWLCLHPPLQPLPRAGALTVLSADWQQAGVEVGPSAAVVALGQHEVALQGALPLRRLPLQDVVQVGLAAGELAGAGTHVDHPARDALEQPVDGGRGVVRPAALVRR